MAKRKLDDLFMAYGALTAKSDSPQVFHTWGALSTIAGVAQRKILMRAAYFDVHTNLYVLLVSPPGRGKKTSAMRTSKNLLKAVEPQVNLASESGSFEALVETFSKIPNPAHQSLTLYSSELGTLMATNAAGMVDFLTDIYDGNPDWARNTKKNKLEVIRHPWLNFFAGTTPKWLGEHLGLIAVEGGLTARTIIAYSDELLLDNPWPKKSKEMAALEKDIVHDLSIIAALDGEFDFEGGESGEAFRWYESWYKDVRRYPRIPDHRTASYYDRKPIHLLKVAMAFSLSYKDELVLTLQDMHRALALLDAIEPGMAKAMNAVGKSDTANELAFLYSQIKDAGATGVDEKFLLIANYHNLRYGIKSFEQLIVELLRMGRITKNGTKLFAKLDAV